MCACKWSGYLKRIYADLGEPYESLRSYKLKKSWVFLVKIKVE